MKKQILLLLPLLFISFLSMASLRSEPDNASFADSLKIKNYIPNHILLTDSVVNFGKYFLNTPYHYGSPGINSFDCSGFTSHVFRNFGYNLERSSEDQAKQFDSIDRTQLKAGDLVFFSGRRRSKRVGHVGIVVSAKENGEFDFIHAAVHKGVTISSSNEEYYTKRFVKASRVIGTNQLLAISKFIPKNDKPAGETFRLTPVSAPAQTVKRITPAEYHQVVSGETLSSIAKKYGLTVAELKQKNSIKGNKLSLKQSLKIKDEETVMVVQSVQPPIVDHTSLAENTLAKITESTPADEEKASSQSSHSVKKGETLFSISKIYNISIEELKSINNIIKGKIHPGQKLKIYKPVEPNKNEQLAKAEEAPKPGTHKVVSGESLFSIAKSQNITVDELKRINNITDAKIHSGQELKLVSDDEVKIRTIVAEKIESKPVTKQNDEKTITHKIKKGENLGSIAKENNMTVDELMKINQLSDTKIHQGQEIRLVSDNEPKANKLAEKIEKKQDEKVAGKENVLTHKVKKGENLGAIAKNNNMTVDELMKINHLSDAKLRLGQEIRLVSDNEPKNNKLAEKIEKKQDEKVAGKENVLTHKVKKGENLGAIAKNNNMTVDELMKINHLSDAKLRLGQEIRLVSDNEPKNIKLAEKIEKKQDEKVAGKENVLTHKVKKGENLGAIAKNNNMTVDELMKVNHLSDTKIHLGQEIKLVQDNEPKTNKLAEKIEKKQDEKVESNENVLTHKIKKGESLGVIAKNNNISVEELKKINNLTDTKIKPGEELKVSDPAGKNHVNTAKAEHELKSIQHKVKSGESFYTIAKTYGCTVEDLKDWNKKSGSKIKVGEDIVIHPKEKI